jgi:hypothetical protein
MSDDNEEQLGDDAIRMTGSVGAPGVATAVPGTFIRVIEMSIGDTPYDVIANPRFQLWAVTVCYS